MSPAIVKIGGSLLRGPEAYAAAAGWIARCLARGPHWIVVSAPHGMTDRLIAMARRPEDAESGLWGEAEALAGGPLPSETAEDLTAALAAARRGEAAPLVTWGERASAQALRARLARLGTYLPVVELVPRFRAHRTSLLVPGFFIRDRHGRPRPLPRGGSDISAVLLAARQGISVVRFWKEGGGVWTEKGARLRVIASAALRERIGTTIRPLHPAALRIAERRGIELILEDPFGAAPATHVRPSPWTSPASGAESSVCTPSAQSS